MIAMTATDHVESRPETRLTIAVEVRQTEIAATTGTEVIKYIYPLRPSNRKPLKHLKALMPVHDCLD